MRCWWKSRILMEELQVKMAFLAESWRVWNFSEELTNEGEICNCESGSPKGIWWVDAQQWGQSKEKGAWSSNVFKNLDYRWVERLRSWAMTKDNKFEKKQNKLVKNSQICHNNFLFIWERSAMTWGKYNSERRDNWWGSSDLSWWHWL